MFRQTGNSDPGPSATGELLVTGGGSGPGTNVTIVGPLGQAAMAASVPVVIASDQSAIDVNVLSGGGSNASVGATGAAVPASATLVGISTAGTLTAGVAGHGTAAAALRVELPTDGTGTLATVAAVTTITNAVTVQQATATNLKAQAENYQGGTAVGAANPLQVSLANTGANATAVKVDGSAATQPVSGTVTANQGTSPWIVAGGGTAGTAASGVATIQGIASMTPVQVSQATASNLNAQVAGDVAHDTADSGNPVKVGGFGADMGVTPTAVTASDRVRFIADRSGVQFVVGGHPNIITLEFATTGAETNTALITVSSGTCIAVTQIQAVVDEANTVGVGLRVGFATSTTPTTTGVVLTHPGMVPGSGISRGDGSGIIGVGASDEDLRITSEAPTGGSLRILISYYTIAIG